MAPGWTRSNWSAAQRDVPKPFHQPPFGNLQQARGAETGDWIGHPHGLTLKNPARHRNSKRRISQVPDFHKSLPHAGPYGGNCEGPVVDLTYLLVYRQV
jgi:hypothetical protein